MTTIIDYQCGNCRSIQNIIHRVGGESIITSDPREIEKATKLILPGVGAFDTGMKMLQQLNLVEIIQRKVISDKIPTLGICLGGQLMTKSSEEGCLAGFGWFDGKTVQFKRDEYPIKIPHMGWNQIDVSDNCPIFSGISEFPRFYFVHSYHFQINNDSQVIATTEYGYKFACAINQENIYGVQFHPEKSHKYGMQLFTNFLKL